MISKTLKDELRELTLLVRSRFPILIVETPEELRFLQLIEQVCNLENQPLFVWSVVNGIRRNVRNESVVGSSDFIDALKHIHKGSQNGVYVLLDAHPYLDNPINQRLIREIALDYLRSARTLVFVGAVATLPSDLQRMSATFRLSLPNAAEIRKVVNEEATYWTSNNDGQKPTGEQLALEMLCQHLVGLTKDDARRLVRQCMEDDGAIDMDDVARVLRHKHESLASGGVLTLVTDIARLTDVGGQARLKKWLGQRRPAFVGEVTTVKLDPPKGVLLLGVQGGGKSLAARAVAGTWAVPLLRLDIGALYNKYHGETERNLREALDTAEAMAPSILWLDEIEKALATGGGDGDGGVSRRVLGTLLTWMSDRRHRVFIVATANDISRLPPELMRKGRFDEIFFVDLPSPAVRVEIFRIHLAKRGFEPTQFDLPVLAQATEGFAGAEIEQVIVSAMYEAHDAAVTLTSAHIETEARVTRPLSVIRSEEIDQLRAWAAKRTVMAD